MLENFTPKNKLLIAIKSIGNAAKGKNIEVLDFQGIDDELHLLACLFKVKQHEAFALAVYVDHFFEYDRVSTKDIVELLGLDYTYANELNNSIKVFVDLELFMPEQNPLIHPLTRYRIDKKLFLILQKEDASILSSEKITNTFDLLECFSKRLRNLKCTVLNSNDFFQWTLENLIQGNPNLRISKFIKKHKLIAMDATLLVYMCAKCVEYNIDFLHVEDFGVEMLLPSSERYKILMQFKNRSHLFFQIGILKNEKMEGDHTYTKNYDLSPLAISLFDESISGSSPDLDLDDILDLINIKGIGSLTSKQRKMLEIFSKEIA